MEILPLVVLAVISSFSHCISMCGGFVFSYSAVKIDKSKSLKYQSIMHLLYGLGRTTTYVLLGLFFGLLGSVLFISSFYKGIILLIIGLVMILIGISIVNTIKIPAIDILNFKIFKTIHFKTFQSQKPITFFIFGILNGFIPCGLVYFFAVNSLSTGSVIDGMLYMGIFGLSTIPALFFLGISHGFLGVKYKKLLKYISSFIIMAYGLWTFIKGAILLNGVGNF